MFASASMAGLSLSILISLLCVAGCSPHEGTVRYKIVRSLYREACQMCLGDHCSELEDPRCRFYEDSSAALNSLSGQESLVLGDEAPTPVESLVHDMMQQGAASWISQQCIPYVSQYTNCDKDNICVGCKSCACDSEGRWTCQQIQHCSAQHELNIDHHVLELVIQALKRDQLTRKKRSIADSTDGQVTSAPQKLEYSEIMDWFYGVRPTPRQKQLDVLAPRRNRTMGHKTAFTTTKPYYGIPDYLDFDEVLNDLIDGKDVDRHADTVKQSHVTVEYSKDYMDLDDVVEAKNDTSQFVHILNAIEDGNSTDIEEESSTRKETPKVVLEPLEPYTGRTDLTMNLNNDDNFNNYLNEFEAVNVMKRQITDENSFNDNYNDTLGFNETSVKNDDKYYSEFDNETIQLDAVNIMKREISSAQINLTTEVTTETIYNSTKPGCIKNSVLQPLIKIISDKEQELKDLIKIKENLIAFIRIFNETKELNAKHQEILTTTSTIVPKYNVDVYPEIQYNLHKINPIVLDKLLYKLKRDIYEVIKDVVGLKKITATNDLPDNLKDLISAMSLYVRKENNSTSFENRFKLKYFRRLFLDEEAGEMFNSTRDYIIKILEILDKNKPHSDALMSLSKTAYKIVRRVINNEYVDDLLAFGLRVYEPSYNITNDLKDIGKKLQSMTAKVVASNKADKLYALKQLHFSLSSDINRLTNAYTLLDFADTRRMIPIDGNIEQKLLDETLNTFKSIKEKTDLLVRNKTLAQDFAVTLDPNVKEHKRKSFLRKIRNLLRGSKNDIAELVRQQVPKKEIVHTIAKKRLGELSKKRFHNIMTKWQTDLNVISRQRRSSDVRKSRMNSIIPKYLRGKLSPALFGTKAKKEHQIISTPTSNPHQVTQKTVLKKKVETRKKTPNKQH